MPLTEHPIEVSTAAAWQQLDADLERSTQPADRCQGHVLEVTTLSPPHCCLRQTAFHSQVVLTPATLVAGRPDRRPEPQVFHCGIVTRDACRGLIWVFVATTPPFTRPRSLRQTTG